MPLRGDLSAYVATWRTRHGDPKDGVEDGPYVLLHPDQAIAEGHAEDDDARAEPLPAPLWDLGLVHADLPCECGDYLLPVAVSDRPRLACPVCDAEVLVVSERNP